MIAFSLIWLPNIVDHSEAEDAYDYAYATEVRPYKDLFHSHHRIYHPLGKVIFELSGQPRAFPVLSFLSGLFSSISLFFLFAALRSMGKMTDINCALCVLGCAVTYGFWRYGKEVEVYPMAWTSLLGGFLYLHSRKERVTLPVVICLTLVGFLVHITVGILLLVATVCWLWGDKWSSFPKRACVAGISIIFLFTVLQISFESVLGFGWRDNYEQVFAPEKSTIPKDQLRPKVGLRLESVPKAVIGLGACTVGSHPIMGVPVLSDFLEHKLFPYREFSSERRLANLLSSRLKIIWILLIILTGVSSLVLLISTWRLRERSVGLPSPRKAAAPLAVLSYVVLITLFEPGNPEMWVIGLPLFWFTIALQFPRLNSSVLAIFVVCLGLTNFVGGILPICLPESDGHRIFSSRIISDSKPEDVYLVAPELSDHIRYARYHACCRVVPLRSTALLTQSTREKLVKLLENGVVVSFHPSLANEDVFNQLREFIKNQLPRVTIIKDQNGLSILRVNPSKSS